MQQPPFTPFSLLGARLRAFRESAHESLDEVSGAVEIESDQLKRIEHGLECPSEDILHLLIHHFEVGDSEATQLYEWAGFPLNEGHLPDESVTDQVPRPALIVMAIDARVQYTDQVHIMMGDSGVVLNFMQPGVTAPLPAARVGMSYRQAEVLLHDLEQALLRQKYLPDASI